MARSLMELYGGGMVYPANNYQLGGVIASARRGREYQGEMRQLKEQQEKIAKEQQRAGMWGSILGTVGSIAGTALAGPAGTAVGAGIGGGLGRFLGEKQYKTTKIGEGKYGKQTRKDIGEAQKEFKAGMGERALVSGLQSAMMGEAFGKISKGIGEGIGGLSEAMEAGSEMGLTKGQALGDYFKSFKLPPVGAGVAGVSAMAGTAAPAVEGEAASSDWYKRFLDEHKRQESVFGYQSGGLINYMMPRRMQGGGYATATGPLQALEQMGFEGAADDERLQDYLEDLPDWQQGYAQQVGDITTAGQQQMGQIGTQMRQLQASSGFGGSGIGAGAAQQARAGVGQEFQRGRRGIVEGFQGDLLTAVRDIESKGEFEFGEQEQTATAPTYEDPFDFTGTQHPEPAGGCPAGSTWNGSQGKCQSDDPFSNDPVMTCTERGMPPPAGGCPPTEYWNSNACRCESTP